MTVLYRTVVGEERVPLRFQRMDLLPFLDVHQRIEGLVGGTSLKRCLVGLGMNQKSKGDL